jgi:ribosomal protein S18 acetylase RimI-like enzyme
MFHFRQFRQDDYSEFRRMNHALYREDPPDEKITDRKISRTIRELRKNPCKGKIIIFEKDKVMIGYSILVPYWSNEYGGTILHVDELYVKPEHRKHGVATNFLQQIAQVFKDEFVGLQLEVTPANKSAMAYYEKIGFRKTRNVHLTRKERIQKGEPTDDYIGVLNSSASSRNHNNYRQC